MTVNHCRLLKINSNILSKSKSFAPLDLPLDPPLKATCLRELKLWYLMARNQIICQYYQEYPKGLSILGPLLFLIYIDQITKINQLKIVTL